MTTDIKSLYTACTNLSSSAANYYKFANCLIADDTGFAEKCVICNRGYYLTDK